jgi:hypothetical protein
MIFLNSSSPTGSPGSIGGSGVITILLFSLSMSMTAPSSRSNSMRSSWGIVIWPLRFILILGNFSTVVLWAGHT